MFTLKKKSSLPEPRWVTIVLLGYGDGLKTTFSIPEKLGPDEKEWRGVTSGVAAFVGPNRMNGRIPGVDDEEQAVPVKGQLNIAEAPSSVTFDVAPSDNEPVFAAFLDIECQDGSFKILPMTPGTQELMEKARKALRDKHKVKKDEDVPTSDGYRMSFICLVKGWHGIQDETGAPYECTVDSRTEFLDQADSWTYGAFAIQLSILLGKIARKEDSEALGK